ncbi:hypothetical protein K3495_g11041 [Podosphaera aphanis]|nr:hypothetical protein K3495_g11041 [Podosphaera aphanis]
MSAFPPHRTITSVPVDQATALAHLSTYLTSCETKPYLLPNARLDPSGGPTSGSSNFSISIHNLRRVEAGLRGELLAARLELNGNNNGAAASKVNDGTMSLGEHQSGPAEEHQKNSEHDLADTIEETQPDKDDNQNQGHHTQVTDETSQSQGGKISREPHSNELDKETRKREKKERRKLQKKTAQSA